MKHLEFQLNQEETPIIKVIGVGGGGCNAVSNMYLRGIEGVGFYVCNTDVQALKCSPVPNKIVLGSGVTRGLGCGADPERGRKAAQESIEEIRKVLEQDTQMVFIIAGMGGGTGTGAAPEIARLAKEMDILTVAVVTKPFHFEQKERRAIAEKGIEQLQECVDSLIVIDNNNLKKLRKGERLLKKKAFLLADEVLWNATRGIAEIITLPGYVNVDFADVRAVMKDSGRALLGLGSAKGKDRVQKVVDQALKNPLFENTDVSNAKALLVNITCHEDSLDIEEEEQLFDYLKSFVDKDAKVIVGNRFDNNMDLETLDVVIIATRFEAAPVVVKQTVQTTVEQVVQQPTMFPERKTSRTPLFMKLERRAPEESRRLLRQTPLEDLLKDYQQTPAIERRGGIRASEQTPPPTPSSFIVENEEGQLILRSNPMTDAGAD